MWRHFQPGEGPRVLVLLCDCENFMDLRFQLYPRHVTWPHLSSRGLSGNVIESLPLNIFCSLDMELQWNYVWPLFIDIDHRVFFIRAMASNKMLVARAAEMLNLQSNCKERGIASICRLLAITLARIIKYKQSFTFFSKFRKEDTINSGRNVKINKPFLLLFRLVVYQLLSPVPSPLLNQITCK